MSKEAEDLQTHVEICALRYQGIQDQMVRIDERFDKLETEFNNIRDSTNKGFSEIKDLIEKRNSASYQSLIAASATVIVSLIGFLGYLLTHLK